MGTIRVVLADDHAVVRRGVRSLLEESPGIEVVAQLSGLSRSLETACFRPRNHLRAASDCSALMALWLWPCATTSLAGAVNTTFGAAGTVNVEILLCGKRPGFK